MGIKNTSSGPAYFKLDRELYDIAQTLKPAQRAKFIYACAQLFFEGVEPENLPLRVKDLIAGYKGRIKKKRSLADAAIAGSEAPDNLHEVMHQNLLEFEGAVSEDLVDSKHLLSEHQIQNLPLASDSFLTNCADDAQNQPACPPQIIDKKLETVSTSTSSGTGAIAESSKNDINERPTREEVARYCNKLQLLVSPDRFYDHYELNGWVDRKGNPIVDWRKKLLAWNRREGHFPPKTESLKTSAEINGGHNMRMSRVVSNDKDKGCWTYWTPSDGLVVLHGSEALAEDEARSIISGLIKQKGKR